MKGLTVFLDYRNKEEWNKRRLKEPVWGVYAGNSLFGTGPTAQFFSRHYAIMPKIAVDLIIHFEKGRSLITGLSDGRLIFVEFMSPKQRSYEIKFNCLLTTKVSVIKKMAR